MRRRMNLKAVADQIQVAVTNLVSTDPKAADTLRTRLADDEPTESIRPVGMPDEEPTVPLRRPRID